MKTYPRYFTHKQKFGDGTKYLRVGENKDVFFVLESGERLSRSYSEKMCLDFVKDNIWKEITNEQIKNMNKNYQIELKNAAMGVAIFNYFKSKDWTIALSENNPDIETLAKVYFKFHRFVLIESDTKYITGHHVNFTYEPLTLEQVFTIFENSQINVILNGNHTAVVTKDSITVGCQVFPINVIDKLVEARDKLK